VHEQEAMQQVRSLLHNLENLLHRDKTHRILDTSLPTLLAYAPWSLLNFVLLLILKNTSSPVELTTYPAPQMSIPPMNKNLRLEMSTYLDVDGGVGIFRLYVVLAGSSWLFLVRHA
jgi:hypothetical protein